MSHKFAHKRLTSKRDFQRLFLIGKKIPFPELILVYGKSTHSLPRIGFAIGKKTIKKAVARNQVKRIIRESFRRQIDLPTVDIIVISRQKMAELSANNLRKRLELAWEKLKCL